VQVDPIKPALKAPGTKRLKPKFDEPLSSIAFKFNLRRYNQLPQHPLPSRGLRAHPGSAVQVAGIKTRVESAYVSALEA